MTPAGQPGPGNQRWGCVPGSVQHTLSLPAVARSQVMSGGLCVREEVMEWQGVGLSKVESRVKPSQSHLPAVQRHYPAPEGWTQALQGPGPLCPSRAPVMGLHLSLAQAIAGTPPWSLQDTSLGVIPQLGNFPPS
jgi:hypothetical protein